MLHISSRSRRLFLRQMAASGVLLTTPGLFAEMLEVTPRQTEGPFYPDKLPLDTDNDLLIINDGMTPGVGEITHLTGRVLSKSGEPVRNAVVEIWQADGNGAYLHSGTSNADKRDGNFQGFGRFLTDAKGQYYFRTIKPVAYPGRTPHIHFAVDKGSTRMLTTQCYIAGEPQNDRDGIFRSLGDASSRVAIEFAPLPGSEIGELAANFDIVIGETPEDAQQPRGPGGRPSRPQR
ncbi:MAG: protocatechuate 3,4-dioxygenase [Planctomycetaceae bacterium]